MVFVSLAVDTLGKWHELTLVFINKLDRQLARAVGRDQGATVLHLRQRLAFFPPQGQRQPPGLLRRRLLRYRGYCEK